MISIDKKTLKINDNNFHKTKTIKTQIIIAKSLRKNDYRTVRLQHKEMGNSKEWPTYVISRNGNIHQHYEDKYYSDFLGIKEIDKKSISIVLENMGCLIKDLKNNEYVDTLNEICDIDRVVEKKWMGYDYWEIFDEKQINSLVFLCKKIFKDHSIPINCINFHHYNKDVSKFKGIVFKSNYFENSRDINPLFNIQKFIEQLDDL